MTKNIIKWLLMIAGILSLSLGIAGIFIPLLPTTPFLLLSATCFIKSSKKLYNRLITHKYLGNYIKNYMEHRAIPFKTKIFTLILLWTTICLTAFLFIQILWIRILLMIIASGVTIHILILKTMSSEEKKE